MQILTIMRWLCLFLLTMLLLAPPTQAKPQAPPQKHQKSNPTAVTATASSESSDHLQSSITSGNIAAGQPMTITTIGALGHTNQDVELTISFPNSDQFVVDEYAIEITEVLSSTTTALFESATNTFSWSGLQQDAEGRLTFTDVTDFAHTGVSLDDLAALLTPYVACITGCDEKRVEIDISALGGWLYEGEEQTVLNFWENGVIQVGASDVLSTWRIQELPSDTEPNRIIAPLWSDFEVAAGEGELRYSFYDDGTDHWLIFEWYQVQEWGDTSGTNYTFNVWFRLGSSDVYVNYLDIDAAGALSYGAIGVENSDGTQGETLYYNGTGEFPTDGTTIAAHTSDKQMASTQITINATVPTFGKVAAYGDEGIQDHAISLDLTEAIGLPERELKTELSITSGATSYDAELVVLIQPDGALTAEVTSQPQHGAVSFDGMIATYTPDTNYVGADSFRYRVVDAAGAASTENTVSLNVLPDPNTAPLIHIHAPSSASADTIVSLDASGTTDADGDALTFEWQFDSGVTVFLNNTNSAVANFTVPRVYEETYANLMLRVSDGRTTSQQMVTVTIEPEGKSRGSLPWFVVLLTLLVLWRRASKG